MKKFVLQTEYNQIEIETIVERAVEAAIKKHLLSSYINNTPQKEKDNLLTRKDLKRMLGMSYPTISKLTNKGVLKGKIIGNSYRYRESDISNMFADKLRR